jgi:RNA polymerase sigma-70 factor (ECF subfamily)
MTEETEAPPKDGDPDAALLEQARNAPEGDLRAFEQLIQLYQKRILADCRYMTRDEGVSEDLAQEVFVKAYFGLARFEGRSSFRHWLQRIKVHHCLNHLKKQQGKTGVSIDDGAAEEHGELQVAPTADRNLESMSQRHRISSILDAMPATLRIPLIMRDMDELSYEEVASALRIGLSAAKMRIKRAREEFRRRYEVDATMVKGQVQS